MTVLLRYFYRTQVGLKSDEGFKVGFSKCSRNCKLTLHTTVSHKAPKFFNSLHLKTTSQNNGAHTKESKTTSSGKDGLWSKLSLCAAPPTPHSTALVSPQLAQ